MDAGLIAVIVIVALILVVSLILYNTVYIVKQGEAIVIERLGKFNRVLNPGFNCLIPGLDSPKQFSWNKTTVDRRGNVVSTGQTLTRVDLRETVFNFPPQPVYTVDTVQMRVNAVMYYRIKDVQKAVYQVDDLTAAVQNVAQAQLKDVFGSKTMSAALQGQKAVNDYLQRTFAMEFANWGLEVFRIELLDLKPLEHSETAVAMKEQMKAERERRAEFIEAEGNKTATRLVSEGEKLKLTNIGVARQEAIRKVSEGKKKAMIELAHAETTALEAVADAVEVDGCSQTDFALFNQFNDFVRDAAPRASNKTIFLPYDTTAVTGLISRLPVSYGRASAPSATARGAAGAGLSARGAAADDELN